MTESARPPGHIALALSRPGVAAVGEDGHEWTKALRAAFADVVDTTWSLHLAAGPWITPLVDPPPSRFDPRRVPLRSPASLADRGWLVDHHSGHVDPVSGLVKAHFSHVIEEVAVTHERVTVTRNGSPVAAILAVEDANHWSAGATVPLAARAWTGHSPDLTLSGASPARRD